jgi:hypothetical protein
MLTGHVLPRLTNMSHVIHKVSFGPEFPGQVNPLDGFKRINGPDDAPHAYKYFLKVRWQQWLMKSTVCLGQGWRMQAYVAHLNAALPAARKTQQQSASCCITAQLLHNCTRVLQPLPDCLPDCLLRRSCPLCTTHVWVS